MANILIVCTANICRSPVASALLLDRLKKRGLKEWDVSSVGTWAHIRRGAADNSILVMAQYGLDISSHEARLVNGQFMQEADLVLCMETGHKESLRVEFPHQAYKIFLLTEMIGQSYSIHDPYGEPLESYQRMAIELTELIDDGMDRIIQLAKENSARE